jgi:hypothetical protein
MFKVKHVKKLISFEPGCSVGNKKAATELLDNCYIVNFSCTNKKVFANCLNGTVHLDKEFLHWTDRTQVYVEYDYKEIDPYFMHEDEPEETPMIKEIISKHVNVFLKDGTFLDGFVVSLDKDFCKLVELDNNIVFFKTDSIGVVRIIMVPVIVEAPIEKIEEQIKVEEPKDKFKTFVFKPKHTNKPNINMDIFPDPPPEFFDEEEQKYSMSGDDFSMDMSVAPIASPTFVRTTPRKKDAVDNEDK